MRTPVNKGKEERPKYMMRRPFLLTVSLIGFTLVDDKKEQ